MARTIDEIYTAIVAEKNNRVELAGLTSNSATAVWRVICYAVAAVIWLHEKYFDQYKVDLQTLADNSVVGSGRYYAATMQEFQEGDTLVVLPSGRLGYDVVDETKRPIKRSSFQELSNGVVLLKVAAEAAGVIAPLTASALIQAQGYARKIGFAGVRISVISDPADKLRAYIEVYYNSLIDIAIMRTNVEAAINTYLKSLSFDGIVYASRLQDAIQSLEGVEDVKINSLTGISSLGSTGFDRIYRTRAGYVQPDTAMGFTLTDTITYIPQ